MTSTSPEAGDGDWRLPGKADALKLRAAMIRAIRQFFQTQDFLEVETPVRIPAPAPESYIEPVASGGWFLQTSPELCMKRLLAAGYPRIVQIAKCFRSGERGRRHLPEFTMLEWYRANADYRTLMDDCENLVAGVAQELGRGDLLSWQGRKICLTPPWERISVQEAFHRYAGMRVEEALEGGCFDETMVGAVEPHLAGERPVFLYDYPAALASLARVKEEDRRIAERFELYIAGMELANAFSELTDPGEQRRRFADAARDRHSQGASPCPLPEPFLDSLSRLPPSAGIALGIDRLAMLFADRPDIDAVVAFTPESL